MRSKFPARGRSPPLTSRSSRTTATPATPARASRAGRSAELALRSSCGARRRAGDARRRPARAGHARVGGGGAPPRAALPPRGRLRERRPGPRGRGDVERVARVARRPARAGVPVARASPRCATGSSRGSGSTCASRTRAPRSTRPVRERTLLARVLDGRRASRCARPSTRPSTPCSGSRRGSPTGSTLEPLVGKRLDVIHGALDRWLPGIPGVSPTLSRRGFERARSARRRGDVHADPGRASTGSRCARDRPAGHAAARGALGRARARGGRAVPGLRLSALRRPRERRCAGAGSARASGACTFQTRPSRSRPRITSHETSICQRRSPCRAEAGKAWWLLCQPSPNTRSATSQLFRASSREAVVAAGRTCGRSSSR